MKKLFIVLFACSFLSCAVMTTNEANVFVTDKTGKPGTLEVTVNDETRQIFGYDNWVITWKSDAYTGKDAFKTVTVSVPSEGFSRDVMLTSSTVESVDIY